MKSYQITYTKGHLIDVTTGKRIFLKRGGTFNILGDDNQFEIKDELQFNHNILETKEKLASLEKTYKNHTLFKIAEVGQKFLYRVGLSNRTSEDKEQEFLFDAYVLEDLYLRSKDGQEWSLCDCIAETRNCIEGEVQMIESVKGVSLNNLFSNMIAFYFPMQRSGACNAFDYFFFAQNDSNGMAEVKNRNLMSIDNARNQARKEFYDEKERKGRRLV